jgi:hypothetical protein
MPQELSAIELIPVKKKRSFFPMGEKLMDEMTLKPLERDRTFVMPARQ